MNLGKSLGYIHGSGAKPDRMLSCLGSSACSFTLGTERENSVGFLHDWISSRPQRYREVMGVEARVTLEGRVLAEEIEQILFFS